MPDLASAEEETVAVGRFRQRRVRNGLRRWRKWILLILLLAVLATGVWLVWFSTQLLVTGAQVTGTSTVSAKRVAEVARVPTGVQLARVDLGAIRARVEAISAIRSADVSRSWPHHVAIAVTERQPVAVVDRGPGAKLQAVDTEGVLFSRYLKRPAGLPLVRTAPDVSGEALREAAHVIISLDPEVAAKVDHLDVGSVDRITLSLQDGRQVLWGSAEESEQKAEVLAVLLQRKAKYIDVSVPGRPVTR